MKNERIEQLPEDDWRKHDARFNEPQLSRNLELVERLTAVADRHDSSPGAVAVAWRLANPAVDGAIVGFRRPDQVDPILAAASARTAGFPGGLVWTAGRGGLGYEQHQDARALAGSG